MKARSIPGGGPVRSMCCSWNLYEQQGKWAAFKTRLTQVLGSSSDHREHFVGFQPVLGFWMIPLGLGAAANNIRPIRQALPNSR